MSSRLVLVLLIVCAPGSSSVSAQVERRAEERAAEIDRIEQYSGELVRTVWLDARGVAWVPKEFHPSSKNQLSRPDLGYLLTFEHFPVPVGSSLIHTVSGYIEGLEETPSIDSVDTVRATEVAGVPAFEITCAFQVEPGTTVQIASVLLADGPDRVVNIVMHSTGEVRGEADAVWQSVLGNWTPFGERWDEDFERVRVTELRNEKLAGVSARSDLFRRAASSEAAGKAWVDEQIGKLARESSVHALDGLLHAHPRVRRACVVALGSLESGSLAKWAAERALRDGDPVVRYESARILSSRKPNSDSLRKALETGDSDSLSGVQQLLRLFPKTVRDSVLVQLSKRLPESFNGRRLIVCALGEWGGDAATKRLLEIWKSDESSVVQTAAFGELLHRGEKQAVAEARSRLDRPEAEEILTLEEAVNVSIGFGPKKPDAKAWRSLADRFKKLAEEDSTSASRRSKIRFAGSSLDSYAEFLEKIPQGSSEASELVAKRFELTSNSWFPLRSYRAAERSERREDERTAFEIEYRQPGSTLLSLANAYQRLNLRRVGSRHLFQIGIERFIESIDEATVDSIFGRVEFSRATGVNVHEPWRLTGWIPSSSTDPQTFLQSMPISTVLEGEAENSEQLVRFLLRGSEGVVSATALAHIYCEMAPLTPLSPLAMWIIWADVRSRTLGESDGAEGRSPEQTYVVLRPLPANGSEKAFAISRLAVFPDGIPIREETFLRLNGRRFSLASSSESKPKPIEVSPSKRRAGVEISIDPRAFPMSDEEGEKWLREFVNPDSVRTEVEIDPDDLRARIEFAGIPEKELAGFVPTSPEKLQAPRTLLPVNTLLAVMGRVNPEVIRASFAKVDRPEPDETPEDVKARELIRSLLPLIDGEIGIGLVGLPSIKSSSDEVFEERLVGYVGIDTKRAAVILEEKLGKKSESGGVAWFPHKSQTIAIVDDFLIIAGSREPVIALGSGDRLDSSEAFAQIKERAGANSSTYFLMNTEQLARSLIAVMNLRTGDPMTMFGIGLVRTFGSVIGSLGVEDKKLVLSVGIRPDLLTEEAHARVRRLVGMVRYTAGSLDVIGPEPLDSSSQLESVRGELVLADPNWTFPEEWSGRTNVHKISDGRYAFTTKAGDPLPKSSSVKIPVRRPDLAEFLRSEESLDLESPDLQKLAREIRGDEQDPAKIVHEMIEWVGENLEYRSVDSATTGSTLATREADCSEYTQLTIALCRSLGIPAREVMGPVFVGDQYGGHAWAEVFIDRWYEFDPTWGIDYVPASHIRAEGVGFGLLSGVPGSRIEIHSLSYREGDRTQRLAKLGDESSEWITRVSIDGDEVLIGVRPRTALGKMLEKDSILYSTDAGKTFERIGSKATQRVERVVLGHGRILAIADESGSGRVVVYDREKKSWAPLPLPKGIKTIATGIRGDSIGVTSSGFVVRPSSSPPLVVIDKNFSKALRLPKLAGIESTPVILPRADDPTVAYSRITNGQQEALVAAFRDEEWSIVGGSVEGARPRRVRRLDEGFWLEGQQSSEDGQRIGVGWYAGPDDISPSFESSDDDLSTDSRWNADWSWSVWTVDGELWLERRKSGAEEE